MSEPLPNYSHDKETLIAIVATIEAWEDDLRIRKIGDLRPPYRRIDAIVQHLKNELAEERSR